jgi:hypothetical protein
MTSDSKSRSELLRRVKTPSDDGFSICTVPSCGRATEARQGNGLSRFLCRYHREHRSRHGSPLKKSYTGPQLKPYVRAAEIFIGAHKTDRYIQWSLDRIAASLAGSGPLQSAIDLGWMDPRAKARAALAMLRERKVPPQRILAVILGVLSAIEEDQYGPGGDHRLFRRVQIAKALRRRASGTHRVYESGLKLSFYPRSSGKVLEVLGSMMEDAADFAIHEHLQAVLKLKQERYGLLPTPPRGSFAKSRHGNSKVPAPPPASSLSGASKRAQREAEEREANRLAEETRKEFAESGFAAFRGNFDGRRPEPSKNA